MLKIGLSLSFFLLAFSNINLAHAGKNNENIIENAQEINNPYEGEYEIRGFSTELPNNGTLKIRQNNSNLLVIERFKLDNPQYHDIKSKLFISENSRESSLINDGASLIAEFVLYSLSSNQFYLNKINPKNLNDFTMNQYQTRIEYNGSFLDIRFEAKDDEFKLVITHPYRDIKINLDAQEYFTPAASHVESFNLIKVGSTRHNIMNSFKR